MTGVQTCALPICEPHPPKNEVPLNCGLCLLGCLLHQIAALLGGSGSNCGMGTLIRRTYVSLQAVLVKPELEGVLQAAGLTVLSDLPVPDLAQISSWEVFKGKV